MNSVCPPKCVMVTHFRGKAWPPTTSAVTAEKIESLSIKMIHVANYAEAPETRSLEPKSERLKGLLRMGLAGVSCVVCAETRRLKVTYQAVTAGNAQAKQKEKNVLQKEEPRMKKGLKMAFSLMVQACEKSIVLAVDALKKAYLKGIAMLVKTLKKEKGIHIKENVSLMFFEKEKKRNQDSNQIQIMRSSAELETLLTGC